MTMPPFSCVFVGRGALLAACADLWSKRGHAVTAVVSTCPEAFRWAAAHTVPVLTSGPDLATDLGRVPFDFLFSVVNHAITAPAVLACPRQGAFNYHDSPLPEFAGFNATAWAILRGKNTHGVTWHRMTDTVDGGGIIIQRRFDIADDDTAFTLSAKCSEAGVLGFSALLDQIETGDISESAQKTGGSFNRRSDRPDVAVLTYDRSAAELQALVRALTFGPEDNWMTTPKLQIGSSFYVIREAAVIESAIGTPGEILAIGEHGIDLGTAQGILRVSELTTLGGQAVTTSDLSARHGLHVGDQVSGLAPAVADHVRAFDKVVTRSERFWVQRLATAQSPVLVDLAENSAPGPTETLTFALPAGLAGMPLADSRAAIVAAFGIYLSRVGNEADFSLALVTNLPGLPSGLYSDVVPVHIEGAVSSPFAAWKDSAAAELDLCLSHVTHARDVGIRYGILRTRPTPTLNVALAFGATCPTALPESARLLLAIPDRGSTGRLTWDSAALDRQRAQALVDRLAALIGAALENPNAPAHELPLVTAHERSQLLATFQDTGTPYDDQSCVHTLFERQVARTPSAVALRFRTESITYRDLDLRANKVARALVDVGIGPDDLVAISIERSIDMVVGLLGILKAGGAYVPLDPVYPGVRLSMMLQDCKARVLLTQAHLTTRLPTGGARVLDIAEICEAAGPTAAPPCNARPEHLAYVIFTSGSTGRPKGVMIEHRNVSNFFSGMDKALGHKMPGVWLAVTSISFDISVLELLWTLSRGFEVVIQEENDRASLAAQAATVKTSAAPMGFGLFYFAAESGQSTQHGVYKLLLDGARFADQNGFTAVWTPERHFHAFGGLYPNPAVTTAALSTITKNVQLRAGSVVLPLHHPIRVAEDWSVIDNLSGGRVGLSFASGWHVNDFAFAPENYETRREVMATSIETVLALWRGEKVAATNGKGQPIQVSILPRPIQESPPIWVASAGNIDTFAMAGRQGYNILTNMLGQDLVDLKKKFKAYQDARAAAGHTGVGIITVMLHTFVCEDTERARSLVRKPFCDYLKSSFDLVKVAPWMFPAFRQPSKSVAPDPSFDAAAFTDDDMDALLAHAFDRYFETAGLFGTPARALGLVEALKGIGANEVACLIDFGIAADDVLASLPFLNELRVLSNSGTTSVADDQTEHSIAKNLRDHKVTHLQCTPSMGRMLLGDPEATSGLNQLKKLLLGGEALPFDLFKTLAAQVSGDIHNMYGPTETTVWSTTDLVAKDATAIHIGKPIANTSIRILDAHMGLLPIGAPGELFIGGDGVVRGYLGRLDLSEERFVPDPFAPGKRLYRTGDLARFRPDGNVEFLGRMDHQVKVNGYRIEVGEIETCLDRHPSVRQSVVVARTDLGPLPMLVAYVLRQQDDQAPDHNLRGVDQWQKKWDQAYQSHPTDTAGRNPRFNTAGWTDSFTGELIADNHMQQWLDTTKQRILAGAHRRVLEIGCGTGMILYAVLSEVDHYTALDVAPQALAAIKAELSPTESTRVTLMERPAHAIGDLPPRSFDIVIINSVAQYFPNAEYLKNVLAQAALLVADGGRIFIGDVRSLPHLTLFHALVEAHQAAPTATRGDLTASLASRVAHEKELLLSEGFFTDLVGPVARIAGVETQLKPGHLQDEMSMFRFDVILHIGERPQPTTTLPVPHTGVRTQAACLDLLRNGSDVGLLADLPNARLTNAIAIANALHAPDDLQAQSIRALLDQPSSDGVDPSAMVTIDDRYEVTLLWARSGDPACFDAVFRRRTLDPLPPIFSGPMPGPRANQPAIRTNEDLPTDLRGHLKKSLPDYMIPGVFVLIDAFPLTPNGKIDRKSLPAPTLKRATTAGSYTPPQSDLETQIASVWQDLLNQPQIGRTDNIFDLGANSLLTVQAGQRLSALLGRRIALVSLFRFPTVQTLAVHLGDPVQATAKSELRTQERQDRRRDAAERRRQLRAEKVTGESE